MQLLEERYYAFCTGFVEVQGLLTFSIPSSHLPISSLWKRIFSHVHPVLVEKIRLHRQKMYFLCLEMLNINRP